MMAGGREPVLSHIISYLRSATNDDGILIIFTVSGFTVHETEEGREEKDDG